MANIRPNQTNLEILRRKRGLTRQNLADATGLSWDKLRSYEIGRSSIKNIPLRDALTITDVLDCTLQDLHLELVL